jgi:hypothetical protein
MEPVPKVLTAPLSAPHVTKLPGDEPPQLKRQAGGRSTEEVMREK